MALVAEAKRVAAEFELSDDDVRKTVTEFMAELGAYKNLHHKEPEFDNWRRRGIGEECNHHEPDSYICHGCAEWHRKGTGPIQDKDPLG